MSDPVRIDLGCGKRKEPGFLGVDSIPFEGVDVVCDLARVKWPWDDGTVDEIRASHFIEHLDSPERCHFFNEAYRVLKKGGKAQIIAPHWSSCRAYGDPTHKWPPWNEFTLFYLNKAWRDVNAPHADATVLPWGYSCDFDSPPAYGFSTSPAMAGRNQEFLNFALSHYKEAAADMVATLVKSR